MKSSYQLVSSLFIITSLITCAQAAEEGRGGIAALPLLLMRDSRIQSEDFKYLGAFALPRGNYGTSRFGYSGKALAPYADPVTGKQTLFLQGHAHDRGMVAQIAVPASFVTTSNWDDLPQATVLQNFHDIADDKWATIGTSGYEAVYGMLAYEGRLIVGATNWYDASCSQTTSHGVSGFDLSQTDDFQGFYSIDAVANARSLGGYMTVIPPEWRSRFGGPALTGNAALSIIGCISSGPAATVFDPDHLARQTPVFGTTVLYYPLQHYLVSGGVTQENTFTFGSSVKGIAFPKGSSSVLFIGRQSLADGYCYGPGTDDPALHREPAPGGTWCYDPCGHSKGGHGYPYYHYVWAYDANDLLAVQSGQKQPWEIEPYASWQLDQMDSSGCANMRSAAFDPETRRLYITQGFGEEPRVEVYQIHRP